MEKGHGGVKKPFGPERQSAIQVPLEQCRSPMMQEKQTGGHGVKQAALSNEHRQWNRFPCKVLLVILQGEGLEEKESGQSSIEKKCGYAKRTIKQEECTQSQKRTEERDEDDAGLQCKPDLCQLCVEEIKADRVTEFVKREDRIIRPVSGTASQVVDMRQVKADVSKIITR